MDLNSKALLRIKSKILPGNYRADIYNWVVFELPNSLFKLSLPLLFLRYEYKRPTPNF